MTLDKELFAHLAAECKKVRIPLDTYDPDFIVGTIMEFLMRKNAALTGRGVRRFKQR